jgi:hypothetical protein
MQMFQIWGVFMVLGGVCGALMAWGVVPRNPDPERMALWHKKYGKMMKIISPFVIFAGTLQALGIMGGV